MKRSLVLLILFFQFAFLSKGQVTFQKLFVVQGGPIFGGSIIQTKDEGFAVTGFNATGIYNSYLVRTDKFGDTLWTNNSFGMPTSLTSTYDGGLVLSSINNGAYIIKTNFDGDTLWTKLFQFYSNNVTSVSETADSGLIILAAAWVGIGNKFSCLLKTDSLGNLIWAKSYQSGNDDFPYCVKQTIDGGYIISGRGNYGSVFLIKTNNIGDTLWTREYNYFFGGFSIDITNDSGYIICGALVNGTGLIKTDSSGSVLWSNIYLGSLVGARKFAIRTNDNGFLITGSSYGGGTNSDSAQLIKVDQTGNIIWARNYYNYLGAENWSAVQTTDGGYAFIGAASNGILNGYYLVKTDSNGNSGCNDTLATVNDSTIFVLSSSHDVLVSMLNVNSFFGAYDIAHGCGVLDICSSVGLPDFSNLRSVVDIFPNPANNFLGISSSIFVMKSVAIFNVLGKSVMFRQISGSQRNELIDVSNLRSGIYFVKVETENGTSVQKLIKQ